MLKVRADQIKHALSKKHHMDFFLTEVKNGSTWDTPALLRMDALAVKKSWANPCITGYEVKVDRQDFLKDDKWPAYREYCHRLYFACPTGLIDKEELPEDVGLINFNPEKGTLYTRKKAIYRDIDCPGDMFYYILLSRLDNDRHPFFSDEREYLQAYVLDKEIRRDIGHQVSSKMAKELQDKRNHVNDVERKLRSYREDADLLHEVKEVLKKHGIRSYHATVAEDLDEALSNGMPKNIRFTVERIVNNCQTLTDLLETKK